MNEMKLMNEMKKMKEMNKRGNLKVLMTEEEKRVANIQELSYDFACRIVRLFQYLNEESEYREHILSNQVYRSGTSIGANIREAQRTQSNADFLSKMFIAYKEAEETKYWIELLRDNGYLAENQCTTLLTDIERLLRILASITFTSKQKTKNKTHKP